jgi:hypothetical protein
MYKISIPYSARKTVISSGEFVCDIEANSLEEAIEIAQGYCCWGDEKNEPGLSIVQKEMDCDDERYQYDLDLEFIDVE